MNRSDLARLAEHFGLSIREAKRRFTKPGPDAGELVMRHKSDPYFDTVCRFLDTNTRRCMIYAVRPRGCRTYPGTVRCGYYDFLMSERHRQNDDELIATTDHRE